MRNTFPSLSLNSPLTGSAPSPFFGVAAPSYEPPDAGAGSGGGSPSSSGDDGGADGAGDGGTGGGGNAYKLTDDTLVDFGDGKPIKWSEARSSRYMDRSKYDAGVQFLQQMAAQMDEARKRGQNGNAGQQQQQQRPQQQQRQSALDLDSIENLAVTDGRTLAKVVRGLQQEGLQPLAQLFASMGTQVQSLQAELQGLKKTSGVLAEQHTNKEFDDFITTSLKSVPEVKGLGAIDTSDPFIRELAKDVYLSHDQNDKSLMKEYPKMLEDRIIAAVKFVQKLQTTAVERAKERRRLNFAPGAGNVKPSGAQAFQFKSGSEIAREFFGSEASPT